MKHKTRLTIRVLCYINGGVMNLATRLIPCLLLAAASAAAVTTAERQRAPTPDAVLRELMEGNARFVAGKPTARDLPEEVRATAAGQHPKAVVLSCLDSRVPVEAVFDQGIGDVFVARVAGNVEGEQTLGSMEFAAKAAGAKLVLVLGHEGCGAVKGSIGRVKMGNLTGLLEEIRPAVDQAAKEPHKDEAELLDLAIRANVERTVRDIRERSPILAELEKSGAIRIVGAYYSLKDGKVTLLGPAGR